MGASTDHVAAATTNIERATSRNEARVLFLHSIFDGCEGKIEIRPLPPGRYPARFFSDVNEAERYAQSLDGKVDAYFGAGTRLRESGG
jgi:hypothetical protein